MNLIHTHTHEYYEWIHSSCSFSLIDVISNYGDKTIIGIVCREAKKTTTNRPNKDEINNNNNNEKKPIQ